MNHVLIWAGLGPADTYRMLSMCHQDCKVGQVTARTRGVSLVRREEFAALRWPVSHHAPLGVVPEGAVWVEVIFGLMKGFEKHIFRCKLLIFNHIKFTQVVHVLGSTSIALLTNHSVKVWFIVLCRTYAAMGYSLVFIHNSASLFVSTCNYTCRC